MIKPFKKPYLIQRVCKPYDAIGEIPESAKGYYLKSGLEPNQERSGYIRNVLRLDYMGSSEYEFGAVPKSLKALAEALKSDPNGFEIHALTFTGKPYHWDSNIVAQLKEKEATAFLLCHKNHKDEILKVIQTLIKEPYGNRELKLKELADFPAGLFGKVHTKTEIAESDLTAWLDLDNPWILCKDKTQLDAILPLLQE